MSENEQFDKIFGLEKKWKGKYKLSWCDLCNSATICCPEPECHGSACNGGGCPSCVEDTTEFNKMKTHVEDYLTKEEVDIYYKSDRLKKLILDSIESGDCEINWKKFDKEGRFSINDSHIFSKEIGIDWTGGD